MPLVAMPDGQNVMMPDNPSPELKERVRAKIAGMPKRMEQTSGGRRMGGSVHSSHDYPDLPFMDRTVIAAMDKPEEGKAYLEKKYGEGSVSTDRKGMVVTAGGKKMRVNTGFAAEVTAQAPEMILGTVGGIAGAATGGPVGAVGGAAAGGMAGKAIKEATKSATGLQRQSPGEIVKSTERAGENMAMAEAGGRVATKGLSRITRGPLPKWVMGEHTPESKADVQRLLALGAKLHPVTSMPEAVGLARKVIIADAITKSTGGRDQTNVHILKDAVSAILTKGGVSGTAKATTMRRLTESGPAMSFLDTGRLIQQEANHMLGQGGKKAEAYLKNLARPGMSPEDAYAWLVSPGQTDRLERFVKTMGEGSRVVGAIRDRELRNVLTGALVRSKNGEITGALEGELNKYTSKQLALLFPKGLEKDLRQISRDAQSLFPHVGDPGLASLTVGGILNKPMVSALRPWKSRIFPLAYYSLYRGLLQNPGSVRALALGLRGTGPARETARAAIRNMIYLGIVEDNKPKPNQIEQPTSAEQRIVQK